MTAFVGVAAFGLRPSSALVARTQYGTLSRCVLPAPFSPTITLRPGLNSRSAAANTVRFLTFSDLSMLVSRSGNRSGISAHRISTRSPLVVPWAG